MFDQQLTNYLSDSQLLEHSCQQMKPLYHNMSGELDSRLSKGTLCAISLRPRPFCLATWGPLGLVYAIWPSPRMRLLSQCVDILMDTEIIPETE